MDTKQRVEWIDMAKGLGIIFVILGHTIDLKYSIILYSFHLPLFFLLSGVVYNSNKYPNLRKLIGDKVRKILKPYVVIFLISLIITFLIPAWRENFTINKFLLELYTSNTNTINNSSIWYLICLFFVYPIVFIQNKILQKAKAHLTWILVGGYILLFQMDFYKLFSSECIKIPMNRLPFKLDCASIGAVFVLIGYRYKQQILNIAKGSSWLLFCVAMALWGIGVYINGWTNLNSMLFGNYKVLFYPIAFAGIYWTISLCRLIVCYHNIIFSTIKKGLLFYGKNSLIIFGFQSLFIRLYILYANQWGGYNLTLYSSNPIGHQIGSFCFVTFFCSPFIVFIIKFLRLHGINLL